MSDVNFLLDYPPNVTRYSFSRSMYVEVVVTLSFDRGIFDTFTMVPIGTLEYQEKVDELGDGVEGFLSCVCWMAKPI